MHFLARQFCKPKVGQQFVVGDSRYVMGGAIGDGAAGLVRKALRESDSHSVAVKLLAPDPKYIDPSAFDDVAARFKREGERGVKLRHPHLITIQGYADNASGTAFEGDAAPLNPLLVMEYVDGNTLESYIRKSRHHGAPALTVDLDKLSIACQITAAVAHLHAQDLVHRDIKPANVFIRRARSPGEYPVAQLGDFGVMKWGDFNASFSTGLLTATNDKGLGTWKYMAPEAAIRPKTVTTRADIYSLGITLFELFTGQILGSPHHVFAIMNARLERGTTYSRYQSIGIQFRSQDVALAALLLDMHLREGEGRPSAERILDRLKAEYWQHHGGRWESSGKT